MLIQRYKELMFSLQEKITDPSVFLNMSQVMTQLFIEHEAQLMLNEGIEKEEIYKRLPSLKGRDLEEIGYLRLYWYAERKEDCIVNSLCQKGFLFGHEVATEEDIEKSFDFGVSLFLAKGYIHHLLGRNAFYKTVPVKSDYSFTKVLTMLQVAELALDYNWEE